MISNIYLFIFYLYIYMFTGMIVRGSSQGIKDLAHPY